MISQLSNTQSEMDYTENRSGYGLLKQTLGRMTPLRSLSDQTPEQTAPTIDPETTLMPRIY